jgi:hypothetical protein
MGAFHRYGHGRPIPNRDVERETAGNGPVTTYIMSPEDLARYGPVIPYKGKEKKPMINVKSNRIDTSKEEQSRRAQIRYQNREEPDDMAKVLKEAPSCGLTKRIYLEQVVAGETNASIERAWGMRANSLYQWLNIWEVKGIKSEQASVMLERMNEVTAVDPLPTDDGPAAKAIESQSAVPDPAADMAVLIADAQNGVIREKDAEIERLKAKMTEIIRQRDDYRQAASDLESMNNACSEAVRLRDKTIARMKQDHEEIVDEQSVILRDMQILIDEGCDHIQSLQDQLAEAKARVSFYEGVDNGASKFQFVDAIEEVVSGMEGIRAFHLGAAIQILWHMEDEAELAKVQHHVERLFHSYL